MPIEHDESKEHHQGTENGDEKGLVGHENDFFISKKTDQAPTGDGGDFPEEVERDEIATINKTHHGAEKEDHHEVILIAILVMGYVAE